MMQGFANTFRNLLVRIRTACKQVACLYVCIELTSDLKSTPRMWPDIATGHMLKSHSDSILSTQQCSRALLLAAGWYLHKDHPWIPCPQRLLLLFSGLHGVPRSIAMQCLRGDSNGLPIVATGRTHKAWHTLCFVHLSAG
jgi:hypothetical protein